MPKLRKEYDEGKKIKKPLPLAEIINPTFDDPKRFSYKPPKDSICI